MARTKRTMVVAVELGDEIVSPTESLPPTEGYEFSPLPEPFLTPVVDALPAAAPPSSGTTEIGQKAEVQALSRLPWTFDMEQALFVTLLDQARRGKKADSGFKSEAWIKVLEVQSKTPTNLLPLLHIDKCKNKESNYKALYKD